MHSCNTLNLAAVPLEAAAELARLYATVRLFINFFQPSFKLAGKQREGTLVRKRYHRSATPAQRLLADPRTPDEVRHRIVALHAILDPVHLLSEMRSAQRRLVATADRPVPSDTEKTWRRRSRSSERTANSLTER